MTDLVPDIPNFLRVTTEEQARRIEWNKTHPIESSFVPAGMLKPSTVDNAEWEAREVERKARKKAASYDRLAKMTSKAEANDARAAGKIWKGGQWVHPDAITQATAQRIMRELPTQSMRNIFVRDYGHRVIGGITMPKGKSK